MRVDSRGEVTQLLERWRAGEERARDALFTLVYDHVRRLAARHLRGQRGAKALTLQPTDLAHELMLKLLEADAGWQDRRHFFSVLALAMRHILIDTARARHNERRGGGALHVSLSAAEAVPSAASDAEQLEEALRELKAHDARKSEVVEMTYLLGLTREQIAAALGVSVPTVDRDLRYGRAFLRQYLGD
jgi:RNA polymerase sigma factor (TIGR02999 family)